MEEHHNFQKNLIPLLISYKTSKLLPVLVYIGKEGDWNSFYLFQREF